MALSRIRNNQIYDATIYANVKIAPGTITGNLFNSNLTTLSDVTIGGNLVVLGTSVYTNVASTNTFVNDPLVVLNNGVTGTNSNDIGFIFNRGTGQNQALIWDESVSDEFRLIGTTDQGTTYGAVTASSWANIHLGNIKAEYGITTGATISVVNGNVDITSTSPASAGGLSGGLTVQGNAELRGGHLTTNQTLFTLLNTNAVSIQAFGAAQQITIGATSGTANIRNANIYFPFASTFYAGQSNISVFNSPTLVTAFTMATTANVLTAMTLGNIGAGTGTLVLNNPNINGSQPTQNLYATANTTTMNFATSSTNLNVGSTAGTANISVGNISFPNAVTFSASQANISVFNTPALVTAFTGATTANVLTAMTLGNIGAGTGTLVINNPNVNGSQPLQNLYTTANTTTMNFATSSAILTVGATSGTANIRNANIYFPNATDFYAGGASINVFNTPATVNAFQSAATFSIGANNTGNLVVRNDIAFFQGTANVNSTRDATNSTTAAFTVAGGAAIKAGMIVGGTLFANASAGSTQQNSGIGAIVIPTGGISVGGTANIAGYTQINGAAQLNNTLTVGGITEITNTTNATEPTGASGAFRVDGGASIAKDLWVGGNLYAANIVGVTANVITVQDPLLFLLPDHTFPYDYDIGIYSSFTGPGLTTAGNVLQHTAVVRQQETNTWTFASNLQTPGGGHVVFDVNTVYDPIKAGNLELTVTTDSTNATSGALIVGGGAGIGGNIFQTGTRVETSASNFILASTPTSANAFSAASTLSLGATSGTLTLQNPTIASIQPTVTLLNTSVTTLNFAGAATLLVAGATSGVAHLRNANIWLPNATSLDGSQTDIQLFTQTATNANVLIRANVILGANIGQTTIQNPTIRLPNASNIWVGASTLSFANAGVLTMGIGSDATLITVGSNNTGNLVIRNDIAFFQGRANVNSTVDATTTTRAALTVAGGAAVRAGMIVGGTLYANAAVDSTTTGIGAIVVPSGGISVNGNINIFAGRQLAVGQDLVGEIFLPQATAQFFSNVDGYSQINQQNISTGTGSSSDFIATASNGNDSTNFIDLGINGLNYNQSAFGITKQNDGYLYVQGNASSVGGNLAIGVSSTTGTSDIIFFLGSTEASAEVARFDGNVGSNGNLWIKYNTASTDQFSGALRINGGVGVGTNVYVANGTTINNAQSLEKFQVKGKFATTLIYTDSGKDVVVIGGSNIAPIRGVTLQVPTTDAMLIPTGPTGDRPGESGNANVAGLMRFNTSINNLEFYTGSEWLGAGSSFTVIANDQFVGNGVQTTFACNASSTTNGAIVAINGVVQVPGLAYSMSGANLIFTEPPAGNDWIDVRRITTTTTVGQLSSGYSIFDATATWANIGTGTAGSIERISVKNDGTIYLPAGSPIAYDEPSAIVVNAPSTNMVAVQSWSSTLFTSAKCIVQIKQGPNGNGVVASANVQVMEALIVNDTFNAYISAYNIINTGNVMGTLDANLSSAGGNVNLWFLPAAGTVNSNIKVMTTYIV